MNGDGCFRAVYTESSPTCLHRVKEITVREECRFIDDNCISVYIFYFYVVVFKQENFNFSFHSDLPSDLRIPGSLFSIFFPFENSKLFLIVIYI